MTGVSVNIHYNNYNIRDSKTKIKKKRIRGTITSVLIAILLYITLRHVSAAINLPSGIQ